jgi:hypothetical protein
MAQGQVASKAAKARRHKAAKKVEHSGIDVTQSGDNHVQEQATTTAKLSKSKRKNKRFRQGKDIKAELVAENVAQPDVQPATSTKPLNPEAGVTKAMALSLSSHPLPSPPISHLEADPSQKLSHSDAAKSPILSLPATPVSPVLLASPISAPEASSEPSCPDNSSAAMAQSASSAIVDQCYDNLLEMIRPQRQALLTGPLITIHIGNTSVSGIYKRSAMAASSGLYRHFTNHPESLEYRFSRGQIHPGAVRLLLVRWMHETCNEFEAHAVPYQKTFVEDIAILRAARLLGMERYCTHILTDYITYLKTELPSYEEIVIVEQSATSDKDPLWTAMVNHLCHLRFKGLIPDAEEFEEFLETHGRLKEAMRIADAYFAKYAKKRADIRENERYQRHRQNEAERRERIERIEREKRAAQSLKKKLEEAGSGLMTVTADEAEMLRGRTYTR